jgi:hypothetical protein
VTEFSFSPDTLQWIRDNAGVLTITEIAKRAGCSITTLHNICALHGIELMNEPPPPGLTTLKPHPRLDPELRGTQMLVRAELAVGRHAQAVFEREAARRRTTPAILMAVALEIIAADALFAAVLDQ